MDIDGMGMGHWWERMGHDRGHTCSIAGRGEGSGSSHVRQMFDTRTSPHASQSNGIGSIGYIRLVRLRLRRRRLLSVADAAASACCMRGWLRLARGSGAGCVHWARDHGEKEMGVQRVRMIYSVSQHMEREE